jgi:drug/metabolite transporter (DMT)-like permease
VCVFAAVTWAWASLYQRARVNTGGLFTNVGLQMTQGGLIGLMLLVTGVPWSTHAEPHVGLEAVYATLFLVVFGSCIAFASFVYLTKVWHPARASSFSYLNPVVAVLIGAWLGNELLTWRIASGLALILASVFALQWAAREKRAA